MNAAAVLRVIVEAPIGPASANLAKFDSELKATAANADAAMGRVSKSSEKALAAGKRMEATGRSISRIGKNMALAVAPLAAIGVVSVKSAMDFKRSMGLIATDAGGSAKEVEKLEKQVLGLARHTQFGPQPLADSLFHVESAGYRGAKAMKVLNESQKLATTGNSDLEATTYALVSATKALNSGDSLKGITKNAAELNEIVAHGDIRLEELTSAMSTGLLPTAKGLGLGIADVGSALDVMTKRGVPAQRSAYALNFTLQKLIPSTEKAEEVFKELGIGQEQLLKTAQTKGLPAALDLLKEKLEGLPQGRQIQKIDEMFGGGRMSKGLLIAIQHVGEMKELYGEVDGNVQLYKKHIKEAEQQPLVKMKAAWSSIQADLVEIGGDLLPTIVPVFEDLVGLAHTAAGAFTGMSPGLQSAAVEAALVAVGLSGAVVVTGKVVEGIGAVRVAMAGLAATNAVTALSGGLGDLRAALGVALGGEMGGLTMVGGEWAGALMGGLTKAIPGLAAAAGIANIVMSATHGDWRDAGFEAGGALVGGIAGFMLGGPLGAALGVGLGSIAGELGSHLTESLFGGSSDKLGNFQAGLATDMDRLTGATKVQKEAFSALAHSQDKVAAAHHRVQAAEQNLKHTKESLRGTEESFKGVRHLSIGQAEELARKENKVREAARGVVVAKRAEDTMERLHGVRLKITKRELEQTVEAEKGVAERRAKQIGPLKHLLTYEENQGASRKRIIEIGQTLLKDMEARQRALTKVGEAEKEAATKISPQFAQHLTSLKSAEKQFADAIQRSTTNFEKSHSVLRATQNLFGENRHAVGKTTQSYEHLKGVMGPFRTETHAKLSQATGDTQSWSTSTTGGISGVEKRFDAFAGKLGITNAHFHVTGEKPKGHQEGGFTVPGTGSGDSFHTAIPTGSFVMNREATSAFGLQTGGHVPVVLEPSERVFMPHEVAQHGAHNLAAMNAAVPRFQKGGQLGPEPHLSGPQGVLLATGQGAIHQVYKGAEHYLAAHQSRGVAVPGGGGAVVEQIARVLFANGFNKVAAAGIIGNAYRESNWNPGAVGTGGGGLWGFTSGAISLAALQAAAKRAGVPWTDVPFQTAFMLRHGGMGLRGALNSAGSAGAAARVFMEQWERPGIPALGERESAARRALAMGYQRGGHVGHGGPRRYLLNKILRTGAPSWATVRAWDGLDDDVREGRDPSRVYRQLKSRLQRGYDVSEDLTIKHPARSQEPGTYHPTKAQNAQLGRLVQGLQHGGVAGRAPGQKWAGWDATGRYHGLQRLAKGGKAKGPKTGSPSDAVAWAMHHLGSGDQWGYPGEWCGAFIAADMRAQNLPVPSGYASAASWANYGSPLGRNNVQAGAILDYGSAHVAMAVSSDKQIQGNDINGQVGTSGIGGIIGGSALTAVRWPPYGTAPGAGGSFTEHVPAVFHGAHTKALSLSGSLPKTLPGTNKEIRLREHELRIYRRAAAAASGAPATQQAIQKNVAALEKRLKELRRQRHKLRQEAAKRRIHTHLSKALGKITGYEKLIEEKQRSYTIAEQFASQTVDLEPQEPILPNSATEAQREAAEKAYVASFESYVNSEERPAYERVLGHEADWRNTILQAEFFGFGKGKPSAAAMEHHWEGDIRSIEDTINAINAASKNPPKSEKARKELAKGREQLPLLRFKERELRQVLGEGRGEFYPGVNKPVQPPSVPLAGSGSLEERLIEVQGTHWPDQHSLMGSLPGTRTKGVFGGAIWDTQGAMEELGLKVAQAQASLGGSGGGGGSDDSERVQLLEELLRQKNQKEIVRGIEKETFGETDLIPHAGAYAAGGIVTALVGEQGPEIAAFPTGTRIHNASETSSMLSPSVTVNVYEAEKQVEVEIGDEKVEAVVNRMDRRAARGANRGFARSGT
jgi:TP901 family phage tail tape measure protein